MHWQFMGSIAPLVKYPNDRLIYTVVYHVILGIDPPRLRRIPLPFAAL